MEDKYTKLVLTRKIGQIVTIGDPSTAHVTVEVVAIRGEQVRIRFSAPRDVPILREEAEVRTEQD